MQTVQQFHSVKPQKGAVRQNNTYMYTFKSPLFPYIQQAPVPSANIPLSTKYYLTVNYFTKPANFGKIIDISGT